MFENKNKDITILGFYALVTRRKSCAYKMKQETFWKKMAVYFRKKAVFQRKSHEKSWIGLFLSKNIICDLLSKEKKLGHHWESNLRMPNLTAFGTHNLIIRPLGHRETVAQSRFRRLLTRVALNWTSKQYMERTASIKIPNRNLRPLDLKRLSYRTWDSSSAIFILHV